MELPLHRLPLTWTIYYIYIYIPTPTPTCRELHRGCTEVPRIDDPPIDDYMPKDTLVLREVVEVVDVRPPITGEAEVGDIVGEDSARDDDGRATTQEHFVQFIRGNSHAKRITVAEGGVQVLGSISNGEIKENSKFAYDLIFNISFLIFTRSR